MTKKAGNSLQAILNRASAEVAPAEEKQVAAPKRARVPAASAELAAPAAAPVRVVQPGRAGLKMIGGHFPPEVSKQLRMLAAEEGTTVQALLDEAIGDLLTKKAARKVGR